MAENRQLLIVEEIEPMVVTIREQKIGNKKS